MNIYSGDPSLMYLAEGDLTSSSALVEEFIMARANMLHEYGLENRLESYPLNSIHKYIREQLSPAPTVISHMFGDIKLIRSLPYPFHDYSITHDGIVYIPALLQARSGVGAAGCIVPTFVIPSSSETEGGYEVVRLKNPSLGMEHPYSIHKLLGHTYLMGTDPKQQKMSVTHRNGETLDNHVQNLKLQPCR